MNHHRVRRIGIALVIATTVLAAGTGLAGAEQMAGDNEASLSEADVFFGQQGGSGESMPALADGVQSAKSEGSGLSLGDGFLSKSGGTGGSVPALADGAFSWLA